MSKFEHQYVRTNKVNLHVVQSGPEDGPLAILLHGFPEYWRAWRTQIPALADAGYRVWAPDQRGYNLSDKPKGVANYKLDVLAQDVRGLIAAAGRESAILIGHDFGGAVAWWVANRWPDLCQAMVVINCPHHAVLRRFLRSNPVQRRRSWYFFAFQAPLLPETAFRLNGWRTLSQTLTETSLPGTFSDEDLELYRRAWSQPGAVRSMINWYRALLRKPPDGLQTPIITPSSLLIWGAKDAFFLREMAELSIDLCEDGRLLALSEATHWVHHEEPAKVNSAILEFLADVVDEGQVKAD